MLAKDLLVLELVGQLVELRRIEAGPQPEATRLDAEPLAGGGARGGAKPEPERAVQHLLEGQP